MRKLISILFLLFFFWGIIGFFIHIEIKHSAIKKEIKTALKQSVPIDNLIVFKFDKKEFDNLTWIKNNEFKFEGKLYDVVNKRIDQNTILVECISDTMEDALFQNLEELVNDDLYHNNHSKKSNSSFVKLLKMPYFYNSSEIIITLIDDSISKEVFKTDLENLLFGHLFSIEIPPDVCA